MGTTDTHTHIQTHYIHTCRHTHSHVCAHTQVYTRTYTHTTHTHVLTHIHTHVHVQKHTRTHTHAHTQMFGAGGWTQLTCLGPKHALLLPDMRSERSCRQIVSQESWKMCVCMHVRVCVCWESKNELVGCELLGIANHLSRL